MATDTPRIPEQGVATLPDEAWERARRRAEIISPLAQSETVGHEAADMAAQALGLSRRQVYVLIRRARQGGIMQAIAKPGMMQHGAHPLLGTGIPVTNTCHHLATLLGLHDICHNVASLVMSH